MHKISMLAASLLLSACAQQAAQTPTPIQQQNISYSAATPQADNALTLQQIMADPKWIGYAPQISHWRWDSKAVYFDKEIDGAAYPQRYELSLQGSTHAVTIENRHLTDQEDGVTNPAQTHRAYLYRGNLFLADLKTGAVRQLTHSSQTITQLRFLTNNQLAYRQENQFFALELTTGFAKQLLDIRLQDSPKPPKEPETFLEKEQHQLIGWVAKEQEKAKKTFQADKQWQQLDKSATPEPLYLGDEHELIEVRLSATGRYALIAYQEKAEQRKASDIMPNYITYDGTIETRKVRPRVADANPQMLQLMLADLTTGEQSILDLKELPGMNDDVLADVKAANKKAYGENYQAPATEPRKLQLMEDWGSGDSSLRWHPTKEVAAVMLEAVDNKDRWIATIAPQKNLFATHLNTQHRLHDSAWVNYDFNSFGWAGDSLYCLSEESGYSNLYLKPLTGQARRLVGGKQEVQSLTLTADEKSIYYVSNPKHPGIYEVFKVDLASGAIKQITQLGGMTHYLLSPDESKLLLTHSKVTQPDELWLINSDGSGSAQQLTQSTSQEFRQMKWQTPEFIAMSSPYDKQPVHAKVFYPKGYDANQPQTYPAVMFVHGAGYLQNVHYGWSAYFREYMFHNLLAEQGYVVMDIDYRASAGYGRDFRTAIYRNMGHPEVEDMALGVEWLAKNAHVDAKRVGVYGGSYGGFLTFMSLFTQPELFRAGAALRPVTDWAHYNAPYTSNILNTPQVDPLAYRVSSPIYHAEGLTKPLLINAPMVDDNVFFLDVVRLVQRLIELEKDNFETAIFPVEAHGFKEPSSWLDEYKRIFKLFEENLK